MKHAATQGEARPAERTKRWWPRQWYRKCQAGEGREHLGRQGGGILAASESDHDGNRRCRRRRRSEVEALACRRTHLQYRQSPGDRGITRRNPARELGPNIPRVKGSDRTHLAGHTESREAEKGRAEQMVDVKDFAEAAWVLTCATHGSGYAETACDAGLGCAWAWAWVQNRAV